MLASLTFQPPQRFLLWFTLTSYIYPASSNLVPRQSSNLSLPIVVGDLVEWGVESTVKSRNNQSKKQFKYLAE